MKLSIKIANPAGNITIFVMNPVPEAQYASVAERLLAKKEYHAEQVAFLTEPRMGAQGRVQMMGGEFCGNATRSYGYLLSTLLPRHPDTVTVEISGVNHPLTVKVNREKGTCQTEMPLPSGFADITFEGEQYHGVCFEGIVHFIVPGGARSQAFAEGMFAAVQEKIASSAYGILFVEGDRMTPVVFVPETSSVIWESSCGSGSMAVAVHRALMQKKGEYQCSLQQPGGTIEVAAIEENGKIVQCTMGGPVSFSQDLQLELPDF